MSEIATFRILEVWGDQLSLTLALSGLDETYPHWKAICFTLPIQMLISFRNILTYTTRWQPIPVLLPGESHRQRSLVGHSPWSREESDVTERLHFHFSLSGIGEGHGNPLQCSCLENLRDSVAWWAAVYGVAQSHTRLRRLSSSSSRITMGYMIQHVQLWGLHS